VKEAAVDGNRRKDADGKQRRDIRLNELIEGLNVRCLSRRGPENVAIRMISADSRTVGPASLFVALSGGAADGHRFIEAAVQAGTVAVLVDRADLVSQDLLEAEICILAVDDTRLALGVVAARFFGNPAAALTMIGITGTNGKTTISYLLEHALHQADLRVGVIGTIEYRYRGKAGQVVCYPAPFTTPDPVQLYRILREMADGGVTHVIMEVSSHALQQQRLGPLHFSLAVFTNLSQDHLDYHRTMEEYWSAKWLLFERHLAAGAVAVVVLPEDESSPQAGWAAKVLAGCRNLPLRLLSCGAAATAQLRLLESRSTLDGSMLVYQGEQGTRRTISSPLVGRFNMDNLLAALTVLVALGIDEESAGRLLCSAPGAPGRLQRIELAERIAGQPTVFVDYAHTPDALDNVLSTLAGVPHRTLYCLVGCGGDRDRSKRPLMGGIAAARSDVTIVTDDNPRNEEPSTIRAQILAGVRERGLPVHDPDWLVHRGETAKGCVEIADRRRAIDAALSTAGPGDIVLIAGKGHEQYQITVAGKRFFDDCLAAREASLLWDLTTLAAAVGGRIVRDVDRPSRRFPAISTDSRVIGPQDIFVALSGDVHDGHDFLQQAVANGAGCLVVADGRRAAELAVPYIEVEDTLTALGDLAGWRRRAVQRLQNPVVVGLTGSCGKTTVKEMTAAIFQRRWPDLIDRPAGRVLKTKGNFNNLVGLPLSLLPLSARHRAAVLEMGMNRPGEIARLTHIADPDIACITNIHGAHLEGLGSIDGVARAKGELFDHTERRAILVVNLDDQRVVRCARLHDRATVGFSAHAAQRPEDAQVWVAGSVADADGFLTLNLHVGEQQARLTIRAPGLHNAANACAAAAIAHAAGIDLACIVAGLESFRSAANRMQTVETANGLRILNDSYNANPASMSSALETLARLAAGRRAALLGDMLELGGTATELHEAVGRQVARLGIDYLGLVGRFAEAIKRGALAGGMDVEQITLFQSKERAVDWLNELVHSAGLQSGDWVLVKASRGVALDTVVGAFVEHCKQDNP
jgi:MurE/MurF fusion protein